MSCGCKSPPPAAPSPPPPPPPCGGDCKVSPPRRNVERLRDPTPAPIVKREVRRLPTPCGDTIERVRVTRQPQTIIERVTEQPRKPAPKIIERVEAEPCQPPIIRNTCVFVDPTPRCPPPPPTPAPACPPPPTPAPACSARTPAPRTPAPRTPAPRTPAPALAQTPLIQAPGPLDFDLNSVLKGLNLPY